MDWIFSTIFRPISCGTSATALEAPSLLREAMEKGTLGAKTGSGLYDWDPDSLSKIKQHRESVLIEWLQRDKEMAEKAAQEELEADRPVVARPM